MAANNYPFRYSDRNSKDRSNGTNFLASLAFGLLAFNSSLRVPISQDIIFNDINSSNVIYNLTLENSNIIKKPIENDTTKRFSNLNSPEGVTINENKEFKTVSLETEDYDMEEIRVLGEKIDSFSSQIHSSQLDNNKAILDLSSEIKVLTNEIKHINSQIEKVPETIKNELLKNDFDKKKDNKNIWHAPLIIGIVLIAAQFIASLIINKYFN